MAAAAGVLGAMVTVLLGLLGVAGYRGGFVLCTVLVGLPSAAVVLRHVPKDTELRVVWAIVVIVAAAVVSGFLVDLAPPSKARLAAELQSLTIYNARLTREQRTGHSWCRPTCPRVERRYEESVADIRGPLVDLAFALERNHLATTRGLSLDRIVDTLRLHQAHFDLVAVSKTRSDQEGRPTGVTMTVTLIGHR